MTLYSLPGRVSGLIFDLDCTLYTHPEYAQRQTDVLIERLAELRGKDAGTIAAEVEAYRNDWSRNNGGKKLSLGNAFVAFGIPIERSVRWREEAIRPELYLKADPILRDTLIRLARSIGLSVVTNNPVSVARRTLAVLGILDLFPTIIGLDTCGVSKPHREPFLKAAEGMGVLPSQCVSVGDRYDIDIALPLELGMGGILVDGVEDVYQLPDLDAARPPCDLERP
jgi:HAD superfamily hydrolase (TIGR01549 family)